MSPRTWFVALALTSAAAACDKAETSRTDKAPPKAPVAPAPAAAANTMGWTEIDARAPLAPSLATQAKAAIAAGKKPFAYLHAGWCPPCRAIEATRATDDLMVKAFAGTHIILIDVDDAGAKLEPLGLVSTAIPAFFPLDAEGRVSGGHIDGGAWEEDIPANMAPPLAAFFAK